jgi:hexosaminidase
MVKRKLQITIPATIILLSLAIQVTCSAKSTSDLSKVALIPRPVAITATGNYFTLKTGTNICISGESEEMRQIGEYLAERLRPATGFALEVKSVIKSPKPGNIYLSIQALDPKLGEEGYELNITKKSIVLAANNYTGLFRGIQTIRQLLPAGIEMASKQSGLWEIPTGTITDYPAYSYRGGMLDVARHFFSVDDVKRFIDFLACYKMNVMHLHLSDDQGWRIEIKSWPNLAIHGGSTQVGGGAGGYYTQEQYADIVKYAKERYITIIPEIDLPGHTNAALASYPELNCNDKATELYTGIKVGFSSLCTSKEITYKFIDDVIGELAAMTPGPYIHIGGDESHATKREDYIPFINRVQEIVTAHNKKVIGWDDIAVSTLKPNTFAQHWANVKNARAAVSQGAKIILSPARKTYLDMQYEKTTNLGLHWAGYINVDSAYSWDPSTFIPGIAKENILGLEAPLWTETITNVKDLEYMVFPRLPGYAEIGWTPAVNRKWDDYKERLGKQSERLKAMNINYYPSAIVPWEPVKQ